MTQTLLSAAAIKAARDITHEIVEVPEWGGSVLLQQMNAAEATHFGTVMEKLKSVEGYSPRDGMYMMLIYSARESVDGPLIFTEEDLPELRLKSIDVLNRLQRIALRINKMDVEGQNDRKKALGEVVTAASPSPSPES